MKHIITASLLALSALLAPTAASAMPVLSPDVEALDSSVDTQAPAMRSVDGGIELTATNESGRIFLIYSITGQLMKKVSVEAAGRETVALPGGCYVVRCREWSKKIVVR